MTLAFFFAYVGSIGPYNALLAPTEWDRDHPWTQAVVEIRSVIYAPILCKPWYAVLGTFKVDRLYTEYHREWYRYGAWVLGRPSKYTVQSY